MPQINKKQMSGLILLMGLLLLMGCGSSSNSPSVIDPATPGHPSGWLPAGHATAAKSDITTCSECHGVDFSGGISTVACTQCHLGDAQTIHPLDWGSQIGTKHAAYVKSNGNSACSNINCHGADLNGVPGSGPSCSSCHLGGAGSVHPQDWGDLTYYKHKGYVETNGTTSCSNINCHGADLTGVQNSGPSCSSCHMGGPSSVHPQTWTDVPAQHGPYVAASGSSACRNAACHGADLQGVYASGPSCFVCHQLVIP